MNQGVASRERDGDEIGLKLHLPRQGALQEHDPVEHGVDERANRPHHEAQDPADPGDAQIDRESPSSSSSSLSRPGTRLPAIWCAICDQRSTAIDACVKCQNSCARTGAALAKCPAR